MKAISLTRYLSRSIGMLGLCLGLSLLFVSHSWAASLTEDTAPWTGTYAQMLERREIRLGVPYDRTIYLNDKGIGRGISVEVASSLAGWLNKTQANQLKDRPLSVKIIPLPRDQLLNNLSHGNVDVILGDLVQFTSLPNAKDFIINEAQKSNNEVLVSGPSSPTVSSASDLSGKTIYAAKNTNFNLTLSDLNKTMRSSGKKPVNLVAPVGSLDGEDLLEMVNDGLIPFVIISDWKAQLWKSVYPKLVIHNDIAVRDNGWIGWVVRSSNQDLNTALLDFYKSDSFTQALQSFRHKDYQAHLKGLKDPTEKNAWERFVSMRSLFEQYGTQYHLDPLFIAALGFQETLLNQSAVSKVGAIGVMQLMPATGESLKVSDIHQLGPNIHAGADYMDQLMRKNFPHIQFSGDNRSLFAVASYNMGPNNVAKARDQASSLGLNLNEWFGNVEFMMAERVGLEPMIYVRNVYKYLISYELKLGLIKSIQP